MKKSQIESIDGLIGNDSGRADAAEYSELLLIFSTMASYASNRNKKKGTWFIRVLPLQFIYFFSDLSYEVECCPGLLFCAEQQEVDQQFRNIPFAVRSVPGIDENQT